ncbi:MAG: hypothetical protein Q4C65_04770 [Eubacteriales bacterium]|nr:hypothetical protein [Eubacteriales bacterium]
MISRNEPVIRVLSEQVKRLDPSRRFLESSPTGRIFNNTLENIRRDPFGLHDVHGPWEHQGLKAQYELYNAGTSLLSSEFGAEGMTNLDALLRNMSPAHLMPPSRDNAFYFHRGAWWNNYPLLQKCFGEKLQEISQFVRASQLLQYEGLRYAVEANRRRAFQCSGTFPWQLNEPFPNNTCTSSVDYYGAPKPAYYGVKQAYAPCTVTARFSGQSLEGERDLAASFFWQSDAALCPKQVRTVLKSQEGVTLAEKVFHPEDGCEPGRSTELGSLCFPVERIPGELCYLLLEALDTEGNIPAKNCYLFTKTELSPLLNLPETTLRTAVSGTEKGWLLELTNTGSQAAPGVWLEDPEEVRQEGYLYFEENYLFLMPGEKRLIRMTQSNMAKKTVRISGWNVRTSYIFLS